MNRTLVLRSVVSGLLCLTANAGWAAQMLSPDTSSLSRLSFQIEPLPLGEALKRFAQQAGIQLVYETQSIDPRLRSAGLVGTFTPEDALSHLLAHTLLAYKFVNARTVSIMSLPALRPVSNSTTIQAAPAITNDTAGSSESSEGLREIVVTAQKREERLQDVPVPVSAISADTLVNNNEMRLQDYYSSVPALNMTLNYNGAPTITIRGLSSGSGTNPTVGIVVDDVPFGSSTALGGGFYVPDIDPSELSRVEVLRGPQGTLYGASSLGGLLKFVTVDPSKDRFSGRVQVGVSEVQNGSNAGYSARAAVNVPLSDTLAVRASAFARRDPGYIDDPTLHLSGVNEAQVYGGHLSALWAPNSDLSLKLSAYLQNFNVYGSSDTDIGPGLTDLQQFQPRDTGRRNTRSEAFSANLNAKLGAAQLVSVTAFTVDKTKGSTDLTPAFASFSQSIYQVDGASLLDDIKTDKFSQEIRLSAPLLDRYEWLLGAFYTHEKSHYNQSPSAVDFMTGELAGPLDTVANASTYQEYAGFGDFTVHFTDSFDVQFGARESRIDQTYNVVWTGPLVPIFFGFTSPLIPPPDNSSASAFTYLVTPEWKVSPDLMLYTRFASGYRAGGPNQNTTLGILPNFGPDKTQNYEIGAKGDVLDKLLSFDASVYYIDWKDIQLQLVDPVTQVGVYTNVGRAKSQGAELSLELHPITGLSIQAWAAWNNAVLTENFPNLSVLNGHDGDRLPYSSRFSANLSLEQRFAVTSTVNAFFSAAVNYIGERTGNFQVVGIPRQQFPAYAKADVRVGFEYASWTINLSGNNITNRRGELTGGVDNINPASVDYIQPRTIGLSVIKAF